MGLLSRFAYDAEDSDETRLEKQSIFLVAVSCCVAGLIWSATYLHFFGPGLNSLLPLVFVALVGSALVVSHLTRRHRFAIVAQIVGILYVPSLLQWNIGGVFDSGLVIAWALCAPIIALMFYSLRQSAVWLLLYLFNLVITVVFDDFFASRAQVLTQDTRTLFLLMNLGVSAAVVFIFASYFVSTAVSERQEANRLLLNILPKPVAQALKQRRGVVADHHHDVSVLFADIVGFSAYAGQISPQDLVSQLNQIFVRFDDLVQRHGLEKIKTIGDAYLVVGGAPQPSADHVAKVALLALDMLDSVKAVSKSDGSAFAMRIGLHCGPVVAGVIGKSKFAYDLWGDTVNVASRMESTSTENTIQVSQAVRDRLEGRFVFDRREPIEIKGKGVVQTYYLRGVA